LFAVAAGEVIALLNHHRIAQLDPF